MTDLMFLLLLFLLIATTLINPNALKLMLPKSSNQLKDKAMTTVSIQDTGQVSTATMSNCRTWVRSRAWNGRSNRALTGRKTLPCRFIATNRSPSTKSSR